MQQTMVEVFKAWRIIGDGTVETIEVEAEPADSVVRRARLEAALRFGCPADQLIVVSEERFDDLITDIAH